MLRIGLEGEFSWGGLWYVAWYVSCGLGRLILWAVSGRYLFGVCCCSDLNLTQNGVVSDDNFMGSFDLSAWFCFAIMVLRLLIDDLRILRAEKKCILQTIAGVKF